MLSVILIPYSSANSAFVKELNNKTLINDKANVKLQTKNATPSQTLWTLAEIAAAIKTDRMLRKLFFFLIVATSFCNCSSRQDTTKTITDSITRLEMNL